MYTISEQAGTEYEQHQLDNCQGGKEEAMRKLVVGWRLLLLVLFFNMLVCACSGRVGWMLFWAIAFSGCAHEYGYEYGKAEDGFQAGAHAQPITND
jgi:hypothetical protein